MDQEIILKLKQAAERYECEQFIANDPIQFPHRYTDRRDIEVSAFISAWMAYGSRRVFLGVLEKLHAMMDAKGGPYRFVMSHEYPSFADECLYRFYKWTDFGNLCDRLYLAYEKVGGLENFFVNLTSLNEGVQALCRFFEGIQGIPVSGSTSANKRIYMFLRWMVRTDSPVDFGIWKALTPAQLVIPLDTHVFQIATRLGLTSRKTADLKTAVDITQAMKHIWPDDPVRGDFALYGTEVS